MSASGSVGRVLCRFGLTRRVLGEFCSGLVLRSGLLGEFCTVGVRCVAGEWWSAGKDSPCSGCLRLDRDNFLPARARWAEMGVFCCAGRVLYRLWPYTPCAGRVLYRGVCAAWVVGGGLREKILPARVVCVWTGIILSLLASNGLE